MPEEGDLAKTVADNRGVEPIRYPVTGQESPAKAKVSAINQVSHVSSVRGWGITVLMCI